MSWYTRFFPPFAIVAAVFDVSVASVELVRGRYGWALTLTGTAVVMIAMAIQAVNEE